MSFCSLLSGWVILDQPIKRRDIMQVICYSMGLRRIVLLVKQFALLVRPLVKTTTFMNESGKAVTSLKTRGIIKDHSEFLVVVDDVDLDVGSIRLREKGSAGGHNGLKSIINNLGTDKFLRLRIGVGPRPDGSEIIDYVLSSFRPDESELFEESLLKASGIIEAWITGGYVSAQNKVSRIDAGKNKTFQGENL